MIRKPMGIEERMVGVGQIMIECFYELPLNDNDINDLFDVVAEIMGAALDVDQLGYDREDVIAGLRSMCKE